MTRVFLPAVGERLFLTCVSTGMPLLTQVDDDLAAGCVLVREPLGLDGTPVPPLPAGSELLVVWSNPAGRHELQMHLVEVRRDRVPLWRLAARGVTRTSQDRRYVRAADSLDAQLCQGTDAWSVTVSDLSEGGARLLVADSSGLAADDTVLLCVTVDETRLQLAARLLSCSRADVGRTELRLEFTNIGRAADTLRRRVFALQLSARAAARRGVRA